MAILEAKGLKKYYGGGDGLVISVGGLLSLVIGIIGILNFTNSIFTGIIARRWEFAVMQSIGMTGRQLCWLLALEGFFMLFVPRRLLLLRARCSRLPLSDQ